MVDQRFADVVIDTDVASLIQKSRTRRGWTTTSLVARLADLRHRRRALEVGRGSQLGQAQPDELQAWIGRRPVVPYDEAVARQWGALSAAARRRGRPRPQNDTWVAASCVRHGLPLVTLNMKDFSDFATYDGLVLLGDAGSVKG